MKRNYIVTSRGIKPLTERPIIISVNLLSLLVFLQFSLILYAFITERNENWFLVFAPLIIMIVCYLLVWLIIIVSRFVNYRRNKERIAQAVKILEESRKKNG